MAVDTDGDVDGAPNSEADSEQQRARFIRRWAAHGMEEEALSALWTTGEVCLVYAVFACTVPIPPRP